MPYLFLSIAVFHLTNKVVSFAVCPVSSDPAPIVVVPVRAQSEVLSDYVETGNRLKSASDSGMEAIEGGISNFVEAVKNCHEDIPAMFSYLDGSSGLGKTQLAFALKRKVLYIPLGK